MQTYSRFLKSVSPLLLLAFVACMACGEDSYTFSLDGTPIKPQAISLTSDPEHPHAGDIVSIEGKLLTLGGGRNWVLKDSDGRDELLLENRGAWIPVYVRVSEHYVNGQRTLNNPLARFTAIEIHNLRGLRVDFWNDQIADNLKAIDAAQCCVSISDRAAVGAQKMLPPLPPDIQALCIDENSSLGIKDYSPLRDLHALRYFQCYTLSGTPIDVSLLKGNLGMQYLDLSGNTLANVKTLSELKNLRVLKLGYCRELSGIEFASELTMLKSIQLNHTNVSDLIALSSLNELSEINANESKVEKLPNGKLPELKILKLLSTPTGDETATAFKRDHPACRVVHGWEQALKEELAGVTRLRIRSGGTCHRDVAAEQTLFEDKNPVSIQKFVAEIAIDESNSSFHCMCCGTPSLEFYKGDALALTLGFHHGRSLRWLGGWPGDGMLKPDSAAFLIQWMADRGVKGPLNEVEDRKAQKNAELRKFELACTGMSLTLRQSFQAGESEFRTTLKKEFPESKDQIRILFRVFGASNNSWTMLEWIESRADKLFKDYDVKTLCEAAHEALLGQDRQVRRGAARLWGSWRSPLQEWKPNDAAELHSIVLMIQQESRYYPLRQDALNNLRNWARELQPAEFNRRMMAGLHDPHPSVRRQAMLTAGELAYMPAAPLLVKILKGDAVDSIPLPEVPPAESADVPEGFDDIAAQRPEPEVAALALGYMKYAEAKPLIEAHEKESPMYAVALALLGDAEKLTQEHFRGQQRNKELQLAAVEAVVRCRGAAGLEFALNYSQATHWWEPEYVARELTTMLLDAKAPGVDILQRAKSLEDLKTWFAQHGKDYLESIRKVGK